MAYQVAFSFHSYRMSLTSFDHDRKKVAVTFQKLLNSVGPHTLECGAVADLFEEKTITRHR